MNRISLKLFFKDKFVAIFLALNIIAVFSLFFYLLFSFQKVEETVVFLHYTVHLGVDLIGSKSQIYFLPVGGFLIFLFNLILSYFLYLNQKYLSWLVVAFSLVIQIFLWIAGIFLVFINI